MIADGGSKTMVPFSSSEIKENYGRFTFTRNNNINDEITNSFSLLAYFENEVSTPDWEQVTGAIKKYDFLNVISFNIGLDIYSYNGTIAWDNNIPPDSRLPGMDNVMITIDFRNEEFLGEEAKPMIKIEKREEVYINGGDFVMGSPAGEPGRNGPSGKSSETRNNVRLSSFYMMPSEVTQKMFEGLMFVPDYNRKTSERSFIDPDYPVVNISWFDAVEFANKLSIELGLTPVYTITGTGSGRNVTPNWNANGWRLPTEAEWEYAARAGSSTPFAPFLDQSGNIISNGEKINTSAANFNGSVIEENILNLTVGIYIGGIVKVGSYFPNAWGLYDMHGNVWEFCWDWFGGDYPTTPNPRINPRGPVNGSFPGTDASAIASQNQRVIRGGSYYCPARYLRSAHRGIIRPNDSSWNDIGFRLVRNEMP
jgi:formylglycine-generating enzyme required for sulfatase activity